MTKYMKLMKTKDGKPNTFDGFVGRVDINGPYYENGDMVTGIPSAIHCNRDELQVIVEYADLVEDNPYGSIGSRFPDMSTSYRGCLEVLEAQPKHKTAGEYLLDLARADDPERGSHLEKMLLRHPQQKTFLRRKR